jgi:PAS domain S-box-containing protein
LILVAIDDVTDRVQAERARHECEERSRRIIEKSTDYIYNVRIENGYLEETTHGARCVAITGYTADELKVNPQLWIQMVPEEDSNALKEQAKCILSGEKAEPLEHRIVRKDGVMRWIKNTPVPHFDSQGRLLSYDGLIQDITERKRLEAQLHQVQRMKAIGTLAGGIAHDFNNLLMTIQGNTSLMLLDMDPSNPLYERLENIEQTVQGAAELTGQLLAFARGGKYEVRSTNLNEIIKKQNRIFGHAKKEIAVRGKYEENLWAVEVDQGQIIQVLLNLYVNAADAMPDGGELQVQTENVSFRESDVEQFPFEVESGNFVKVSVTDTGVGMDEVTQAKIFEPFFTTKEMGRGTGLGLASAYGIVRNHGGIINVYSRKGEGTTFNFCIPASKNVVKEEKKSPEKILQGEETVLLVDDEETVIDVGQHMMEKMGYKVLTAKDGKTALEVYAKNRERIKMVIIDMVMPGMGGGQVYDRIKELNPAVKALLSSGYSMDGKAAEIMNRGCDGFLQKPFSMKELSKKMREILGDGKNNV